MEDTPSPNKYDIVKRFIDRRNRLAEGKEQDWPLRAYHMPNFNEEQDRTTQLFHSKYVQASKSNPDWPLWAVVTRLVNRWATVKNFDFDQPFDEEFIKNFAWYVDFLSEESVNVFSTTSYIQYMYRSSGSQLKNNILLPICHNKVHFRELMALGRPEDIFKQLSAFKGLGDMVTVEVVRDVLRVRRETTAENVTWDRNWRSYHVSRALNYLKNRGETTFIPKDMVGAELDEAAFKLGLPPNRYYMGRVMHIFSKTNLVDVRNQMPYLPMRALKDSVPSFKVFMDEVVNAHSS